MLETTAFISNQQNTPGWDKAVDHFWILFWGSVPVVADEQVSKAVDRFADALDTPNIYEGIPLRNASMELARACRRSLAETWKPISKNTKRADELEPANNDDTFDPRYP